jgi:hypothetical protein
MTLDDSKIPDLPPLPADRQAPKTDAVPTPVGTPAFEALPDNVKYPLDLRQQIVDLDLRVRRLTSKLEKRDAELRDLGSYKTAIRFLKITWVSCSILTAIGAFLAGTDKTVLFIPPHHNSAVGLAF